MKKNVFKIIALLILCVLIISAAACGSQQQSRPETPSGEGEQTPEGHSAIPWKDAAKNALDANPGLLLKFELSSSRGVLIYGIDILGSDNKVIEADINALTGGIVRTERKNKTEKDAEVLRSAVLTHEDAVNAALKEVPGSAIRSSELETELGKPVFETEVTDEKGIMHSVVIDARSGEILSKTQNVSADRLSSVKISRDEAASKAQTAAGGGTIAENILEFDDGKLKYEVTVITENGTAYEAEIDAVSGDILRQQTAD